MSHYHLLRRLKILIQVSKYFPVTSTNIASYCFQEKHASNILIKPRKILPTEHNVLYSTQKDRFNSLPVDAKLVSASKGEDNDEDEDDFDNNKDDVDVGELEENVESTKVRLPKSGYFIKQFEEASDEEKAEKGLQLLTNSILINQFDRKERLEFAQKIWSTLVTNLLLKEEFCKEYLNFMAQNYGEVNPYIFFSDLLKNHIMITESILLSLLECAANLGKKAEMDFIVNTIKEKNLFMTEEVNYLLMLGYAKAGDSNEVMNIFQKLKSEGDKSQESHVAYLKALACLGEENLLMKHYNYMQENGMVLLDGDIFAIVEALLIGGHLEVIKKVLKWKSGFELDKLKSFIVKLLRLEYDGIALALIPALPQFQNEDHDFVSFVIRRAVKSNLLFEELVLLCKVLISKKASEYTYHAATKYLLKNGSDEECYKMLEIMRNNGFPIRNHYFWPILARLRRAEKWEDAFKVLEKMKEYNVDFHKIIFFYFHRLDPDVAIFKICNASGWNINVVVQSFFINRIKRGNFEKIENLLSVPKLKHVIKNVPSRPLAVSFATLVMRKKYLDLEKLVQLLQHFDQKIMGEFLISLARFAPDDTTITSLLEIYSQNNLKISEKDAHNLKIFLPLKSSENLDLIGRITEKQKILNETELNKKKIPDVAHLHRKIGAVKTQQYFKSLIETAKKEGKDYSFMLCNLLSSYVQCGDIKNAAAVRNEMLELCIPVTPGIKAKLFALSTQEKDLEYSTLYYEDLIKNHPDFGIDRTKILDFTSLLVENDLNDEALKILNFEHPMTPNQPLEKLQSHSVSLLKNVAKHKDSTLFRKYAEVLVEKRYAQLDARLYAPLIRMFLEDDDCEKACEEFKYCAQRLNVAPLPQQLIMKLVEKEDEEKLGAILDVFRRVQNPTRVNVVVSFALAELNRIENLKNYIRKFDVDFFSNDWSLRYFQYYSNQGISDPLECLYFALHPEPECNRLIPYIFESFDNNKDKSRSSKFLRKLNEMDIQFPEEHVKLLASKIHRPLSS